jgi:hypothetical protein
MQCRTSTARLPTNRSVVHLSCRPLMQLAMCNAIMISLKLTFSTRSHYCSSLQVLQALHAACGHELCLLHAQ